MSSDKYLLPRDDAESKRLLTQHEWFTDILHGRLVADDSIKPETFEKVLDAGTGSGVWLLDISKHVKDSTVLIGTDLSPTMFPPADKVPSNIHFYPISSLNLPGSPKESTDRSNKPETSEDWSNSFDFINQRCLVAALTEEQWKTVLKEFLRVLKPGAHVQFLEPRTVSKDDHYFLHKIADVQLRAAKARGQLLDISERLGGFLEDAGFMDVKVFDGKGLVGRCNGEQGEKGAISMETIVSSYLRGVMQAGGMGVYKSQEEADEMKKEVLEEWDQKPGMFFELRATCAMKPL